ncbi:MAG: hypothetical protein IJY89_01470, partial [Clostridia bacterium]|nr:hypothetical protein [Clostridia bacterium]
YGKDTRINVPGKADDNWSYRVTAEQVRSIDLKNWHTTTSSSEDPDKSHPVSRQDGFLFG